MRFIGKLGAIVLILLLALMLLPMPVVAQMPPPPMTLSGYVYIGAERAPDDTLVQAKIAGEVVDYCDTVTTSGGEQGFYALSFEDGTNDEVSLFVEGTEADESPVAYASGHKSLDLHIAVAGVTYYMLTVTREPTVGGSVALSPSQPDGGYEAGTSVQLTATANEGYSFDSWSGHLSGSTNPDTITMNSNKSVTATFAKIALAVTTDPATYSTTTATLKGRLTGLGDASSVEVSFEWGRTTAYGSETSAQTMTDTGSFTASLTGLSSSTTYWFKAKAKAVGEETYGLGLRFTTRAISTVSDGGGGGGGSPYYHADMNLFGTKAKFYIDSSGEIQKKIEATSEDGNLTIGIPKRTTALGKDGKRLKSLEVAIDESPPDPPKDAHVIGLPYIFEPSGATFDPGITFTWSYDPDALPEDVAEEDLVLAYYDEDADEWVELDCEVDTKNNTITASVEHFTTFAIIGAVTPPPPPPPAPAAFSVSNLSIQPAEVQLKEAVTITVSVANTGGSEGSYTVVLKINGVKEEEKSVTIAAGRSQSVSFSVSKEDAGSYSVVMDGVAGSFTVVAPAIVPAPAPAPEPEPEVKPPFNWPLVGGIIGGVLVVVGLLIFFLAVRRRVA